MRNKKFFNSTFVKVLFSLFLGITTALIGTYYIPTITLVHARNDQEFGFNLVKSMISNNQTLNDAIAVESTKSSTQYGKEFYNNISDLGRRSIIAHPYDKQGSGALITVSYVEIASGERFVLLMEKLQVRNNLKMGLQSEYDQIGGYTHGAGVEGTKVSNLTLEETDAKDKAEDENTTTGLEINLASKTISQKNNQYITKKYLEDISAAINQYYKNAVKENPYIQNLDPSNIKRYLKTRNIEYDRDYNVIDTVIREFKEETGYSGTITRNMIKEVYNSDNYGIDNVANLHTRVAHYVIDLGKLDKAPNIYETLDESKREPGSFRADGKETGRLSWAKFSELKCDGVSLSFHDKPIRGIRVVPFLNNAIRLLRDIELQEISKGVITSQKHIIDLIKHFAPRSDLNKLSQEFGKAAEQRHKLDKCIAKGIGSSSIINSKKLSDTIKQCRVSIQ